MEIIRDLAWLPELPHGSVVTLGEFDGVHRGHRVVLSSVNQLAAVLGCPSVVVTFDQNPLALTDPQSAPLQLSDLDHQLELIAMTGIDMTVVLPAERVAIRSEQEADRVLESLIEEVVVGALGAKRVIVGEDFNFGDRRRSTIEILDKRSAADGYEVVRVPVSALRDEGGEVISSTAVRKALSAGDVGEAGRMLGRRYELRGEVVQGERRGRTLGFPTANLPVVDGVQVPADGVYAGWLARADGQWYPCAVNVGRRPTFYESGQPSLVEAHLIGFRGDLYGEHVRLLFAERLRGEQKFTSGDQLAAQVQDDIKAASECLKRPPV